MQKPDPNNSEHNAFVQDWLIEWAKEHTVFASEDWHAEAARQIKSKPMWAKQWGVTVKRMVEDAQHIQFVIDHIQETYSEEDKESRKDHFEDRFPDIQVNKVIIDRDLGGVQVNGKTLDGRRVWISLHTRQPVIFKRGLPFLPIDED
jgi:hypothetical protein